VGQAVIALFRRLLGVGATAKDEGPVELLSADPEADVRSLTVQLQGLVPRIAEIERRGVQIEGDLDRTGGPARVLLQVLVEDLQPQVQSAQDAIARALVVLAEKDPEDALLFMEQSARIGEHLRTLQWVEQAFDVLAAQARWRRDPDLREVLDDADAIAAAFLRPMLEFLDTHGLRFTEEAPIAAPGPGMESVWFNLLPNHPVVQVPDDFAEDLLRWPSVAHEVAHVVFRDVPGLSHELHAMVPAAPGAPLAQIQGRKVLFDVERAFAGWIEEIFADAFCMMMLGPAALHGMVAMFEAPHQPLQVTAMSVGPGGAVLGEHPPRHLRILLAAWFLERMGYLIEPEQIRRDWDRAHGAPTDLHAPTGHDSYVAVPLVRFRVYGQQLLERFYTSNYAALAGYPLSAITGLEMSPGLWARAKKEAKKLLDGRPFVDDPRVVIAAAIEAAVAQPGAQPRIAKGVRRAVVGLGLESRPLRDENYARPAVKAGRLSGQDFRDAVILGALLKRPARRARRAG
jgi:hypothetical protein